MSLDGKDLEHLLALAERAARAGGEIARSHTHGTVTDKGDRDLVSEADIASETAIRDLLVSNAPDIPVLGEERGGPDPTSGPIWVVDPIDGTVNHMHGLPNYAVAISLLTEGQAVLAATYLPETNIMYTAIKGLGAQRNGRPVRCSDVENLHRAVVAIDQFTFTTTDPATANAARLRIIQALIPTVGRIRIYGASAVDLAWVADGKLDACIMLANNVWDTSGGVLLAREAGAVAIDLDGVQHAVQSTTTVAVTASLADAFVAFLRKCGDITADTLPTGDTTDCPH